MYTPEICGQFHICVAISKAEVDNVNISKFQTFYVHTSSSRMQYGFGFIFIQCLGKIGQIVS